MADNGNAGAWKYGIVTEMNANYYWLKVKEDGTETIWEMRPAHVIGTMNPRPQVNDKVQFTVKDEKIENIKCYDKEPEEEHSDSDDQYSTYRVMARLPPFDRR